MTLGQRIREARERQRLTQQDVADYFGISRNAVSTWENDVNVPDPRKIRRLADLLSLPLPSLAAGEEDGDVAPSHTVRLVGYVGAGAEIFPVDDHAKGAGLDEVEAPPGPIGRGVVAVKVRGDSMLPAYEDGDIIYYGEHEADPRDAVGRVVVVCLADDRMLIKRLGRGRKPGCFDLISYNGAVMEDQRVKWVAKFQWVRKAQ